jgi:hypothetical protein
MLPAARQAIADRDAAALRRWLEDLLPRIEFVERYAGAPAGAVPVDGAVDGPDGSR